jgi:hypothetical protein
VRRAQRALGLAAIITTLGCSHSEGSDSLIVVMVTELADLPTVAQLRVVITSGELSETKMFPQVPAAGGIDFGRGFSFSFRLAASRAGLLSLAIDALDPGARVVAKGVAEVPILVGKRTDAVVSLGLVSEADAGIPDSDAAELDGSGTVD